MRYRSSVMTPLRQFRIVALLEGVSFLLLLFVAMPLKHYAGMPVAVRVAGMTHGLLFVLFVGALLRVAAEEQWPFRKSLLAFIASLLPFGTIVFDRSLRPIAKRDSTKG